MGVVANVLVNDYCKHESPFKAVIVRHEKFLFDLKGHHYERKSTKRDSSIVRCQRLNQSRILGNALQYLKHVNAFLKLFTKFSLQTRIFQLFLGTIQ